MEFELNHARAIIDELDLYNYITDQIYDYNQCVMHPKSIVIKNEVFHAEKLRLLLNFIKDLNIDYHEIWYYDTKEEICHTVKNIFELVFNHFERMDTQLKRGRRWHIYNTIKNKKEREEIHKNYVNEVNLLMNKVKQFKYLVADLK